LALAAKKVAPRPSLGTLLLAALFVDGIWPIFLLLGWEHVEIVPGITAVTPLLFVSYTYTAARRPHSFAVTRSGETRGATAALPRRPALPLRRRRAH
jgi:hypothetical protein